MSKTTFFKKRQVLITLILIDVVIGSVVTFSLWKNAQNTCAFMPPTSENGEARIKPQEPYMPSDLDSSDEKKVKDIQAFAAKLPLPAIQSPTYYCIPHVRNVLFFKIEWGVANDCLAGCFYSSVAGVWHDGKVGLIYLQNYGNDPSYENIPANFWLEMKGPLTDVEVIKEIRDYAS
jgi:hypothetical protein